MPDAPTDAAAADARSLRRRSEERAVSAKASLELKYDGGLGTATGNTIVRALDAKPWAAAIWRRMLRARVFGRNKHIMRSAANNNKINSRDPR